MSQLRPVHYGKTAEKTADIQRSFTSRARFEDVVASVKSAIANSDFWLLHEINPQALLQKGGYAISPTRQLFFFHPDYMARLLSASPAALLEAPLKFAIMDLGDEVVLRWFDPTTAFARYDDADLARLGEELAAKCEAIAVDALSRITAHDSPRLTINQDAPTLATTELEIAATPAAVWAVLADIEAWTGWMPEILSAGLDGPLAIGSTIHWEPFGQKVASRIVAIEPERKLIWNGTDGAVHVWELFPTINGTLLRNSESIETWKAAEATHDGSAMLLRLLNEWSSRLAKQAVRRSAQ
ncbi:SRPBCC family protein [Labrys neptuniae]